MEPSPPPQHTWAGASLSAVPRGVPGALAARAAVPSRARVSSPPPRGGDGSGANVPCMARPCGRASPPSLQRSARPRARAHPLGSADIPACCRQPPPACISGASPAPRHKRRGPAEPDGLCQGRTMTPAPEAAAAAACRAARGWAAGSQQDTSEVQPAAGSTSEAYPVRQGRHLQGKYTRRASRAAKQLPGALINKPI